MLLIRFPEFVIFLFDCFSGVEARCCRCTWVFGVHSIGLAFSSGVSLAVFVAAARTEECIENGSSPMSMQVYFEEDAGAS